MPADIGDNLLKLGFERFGDWSKARTAKQLAERTAGGVVSSLERFFESEHVDPNLLKVAATDLGATVGNHVDAAFLVDRQAERGARSRPGCSKPARSTRSIPKAIRYAIPTPGW